jgi:hypothetical protein
MVICPVLRIVTEEQSTSGWSKISPPPSRVAKPMTISAEHQSSNVALITAPPSGGSSRMMHSSRNKH